MTLAAFLWKQSFISGYREEVCDVNKAAKQKPEQECSTENVEVMHWEIPYELHRLAGVTEGRLSL